MAKEKLKDFVKSDELLKWLKTLTVEILSHSSLQKDLRQTIKDALCKIKDKTNISAIGIRFKLDEDYPFYETIGFPDRFIKSESSLCSYDESGEIIRRPDGNPVLDCMCGNIINGQIDTSLPFFTEVGSFWTNSTTKFDEKLATRKMHLKLRNRCNKEGFESMALVPLRVDRNTIGILQLNEYQQDYFTSEIIDFFEELASIIAIALTRATIEEQLKESEEKFRNLFEHMKSGVAVYDAIQSGNDFIIRDFNKAGEEINQVKRDEVIGRRITKVFPGIKEFGLIDVMKRVWETGNPESFPIALYGDERISGWRENYVYKLHSGEIVTIYDDVTERKHAEDRFKIVANNSIDLIYEWNIMDDSLEWFGDIDKALGYTPGEIPRTITAWLELIHPDDRNTLEEAVAFHRNNKEPIYEEYRVRTKDGSWRYWEDRGAPVLGKDGEPIMWVGGCTDVTERRNSAEKLRLSRERLELAVKGSDVGMWDWNIKTNKAVFSERWMEMLGYSIDELEGHFNTFEKLLHPEDRERTIKALHKHFDDEEDYYVEFRLKCKSGDWKWILSRGKVFERDKDGAPVRMAGTHLDIDDQKRVQIELETHRDHLEGLVEERTDKLKKQTDELKRTIKLMADREIRMTELKDVIKVLHKQLLDAGLKPLAQDPFLNE